MGQVTIVSHHDAHHDQSAFCTFLQAKHSNNRIFTENFKKATLIEPSFFFGFYSERAIFK
jgi:hypothetical protein